MQAEVWQNQNTIIVWHEESFWQWSLFCSTSILTFLEHPSQYRQIMVHSCGSVSLESQKIKLLGGCRNYKNIYEFTIIHPPGTHHKTSHIHTMQALCYHSSWRGCNSSYRINSKLSFVVWVFTWGTANFPVEWPLHPLSIDFQRS